MTTARAPEPPGEQESIDFLIITPLDAELAAFLNHLPSAEKLPVTEDGWEYFRAVLPLPRHEGEPSDCQYRLIILPLRQAGTKRAVSAAKDAIRRFRPRAILLIGIAGGIAASGARLGDILVADQILDYERQIVGEKGLKVRPSTGDIDRTLHYAAESLKSSPWHEGCLVSRPAEEPPAPPQCLTGPMASGEKLIKDNEYLRSLLPQWPNLLGCEMEASGVITAASESAERPRVLMIRGVSDLADKRKLDPRVKLWRDYACDVAACFAVALLRSRPLPAASQIRPTAAQVQEAIASYCERLIRRFGYADHRGVEGANRVEHVAGLPLEQVYVLPELFSPDEEKTLIQRERELQESLQDESLSEQDRQRLVDELDATQQERWRPRKNTPRSKLVSVSHVMRSHCRLVILGGPGSGKSTFLRYLALQLAQKRLPGSDESSAPLDLLPLHISLAAFAAARLQEPGLSLGAFIERSLSDGASVEVLRAAVRQRLIAGTAILLCDGLDEVAEGAGRDGVVQAIDTFPADYPQAHLVVTSRPIGYTRLRGEVTHYILAHFSDRQIEHFLFLRELALERRRHPSAPDEESADSEARAIYQEIQRHPRVAELARNPLMLVIIALIREERAHLPEQRVQFYECAVKTLMDTWNSWRSAAGNSTQGRRLPTEQLIPVWATIALWMRQERPSGVVGRAELIRKLSKILIERELDEEVPELTARSYLDAAATNAGLLEERRHQVFAFWHPTFEEFLAAVALARPSHRAAERLLPLRGDPRFAEVMRLAVGHIGIVQQDQEAVTDLVHALADREPGPWEPVCYPFLRQAAACIADGVGVRRSLAESFVRRLAVTVAELPYEPIEQGFISLAQSLPPVRADEATVSALALLVEHDSVEVRTQVARLLRRAAAEIPQARDACERLLADPQPLPHAHAALALAQAGIYSPDVIRGLAACSCSLLLIDDARALLKTAPHLRRLANDLLRSEDATERCAAAFVLGMGDCHDEVVLAELIQALKGKSSAIQDSAKRLLTLMAGRSAQVVRLLLQAGLRPLDAHEGDAEKTSRREVLTLISGLSRNDCVLENLALIIAGEHPGTALDIDEAERTLASMQQASPTSAGRLVQILEERGQRALTATELRLVRFLNKHLGDKHRSVLNSALARFLAAEDLELRYQAAWSIVDRAPNDRLARKYHAALVPCLSVGGRLTLNTASLLFESRYERTPLFDAVWPLLQSEELSLRLEAAELLYQLRQSPEQAQIEHSRWSLHDVPPWEIGQRCSSLSAAERADLTTALLPCMLAEEKSDRMEFRAYELLRKLGPLNAAGQEQLLALCAQLPPSLFLPLRAVYLFQDLAQANPSSVLDVLSLLNASQGRMRQLAYNMLRVMAAKSADVAALLAAQLEEKDPWKRFTIAEILHSAERKSPALTAVFRGYLAADAPATLRLEAVRKLLPWGTETVKREIPMGALFGLDEDVGPMHTIEVPMPTLTEEVTDAAIFDALHSCLAAGTLEVRFDAAALLHRLRPAEDVTEALLSCLVPRPSDFDGLAHQAAARSQAASGGELAGVG